MATQPRYLSDTHDMEEATRLQPPAVACPEEIPENRLHTPSSPPIISIDDLAHMLLTHKHEEFASLAALYENYTYPPCEDVSWAALLRPSPIQNYIYGGGKAPSRSKSAWTDYLKSPGSTPSFPFFNNRNWTKSFVLGMLPPDELTPNISLYMGRPPTRPSPHVAGHGITS
jgi:hypothetical protein